MRTAYKLKTELIPAVQASHGTFRVLIARNRNLKIGRLLKANHEGKLICARNKREGQFVFIRYIGDLVAEVRG